MEKTYKPHTIEQRWYETWENNDYFSPSQDDARLFQKYRNKEKPDAFIEVRGSMKDVRLDGYVDFAI